MKHLMKILSLGAALAAAPFAKADSIQFTGNLTFNSSTGAVTFDNTQSKVNVGGNGVLSPFTTNSSATFYNFNYSATPATTGTELLSVIAPVPNSADTVAFYMTSEAFASTPSKTPGYTNYDFSGGGFYTLTVGKVSTVLGSFDLTTQAQGNNTGPLSFSDLNVTTTAATPEPSSLVLLGSGLVSAAGMLLRRRRVA